MYLATVKPVQRALRAAKPRAPPPPSGIPLEAPSEREHWASMTIITTCPTSPPPTKIGPSTNVFIIALAQRGCPTPLLRYLCRGRGDALSAVRVQGFGYDQFSVIRNPFKSRIMASVLLKCKGVPRIAKPDTEGRPTQGEVGANCYSQTTI